jgi:hypothetical protein
MGETGLQAVFSYAVPMESSHYPYSWDPRELTGTTPGLADPANLQHHPSYHGEISLNPSDGSILRLTVMTELKPNDPIEAADILLEYGQLK